MPNSYLLGIDVGTSGTKSVIVDTKGKLISKGYIEYSITMPKTRWAEQDPRTWWNATIESLRIALRRGSIPASEIAGIGLSGQMNSPGFIGEDGDPLRPSILWMDTRAEPQAEWVRQKTGEEAIQRITGVKVAPFYSYCKMLWVKENQPRILERTKVILQPKDYVGFRLTDNLFLDKALASSNGLLDIRQGKYAIGLLEEMGLPTEVLPKLVLPNDIVGGVTKKAANLTGLAKDTPVVAGSGDVMTNAVGSGVVEFGRAYNKTATASDLVVCVDHPIVDPKSRVVTYAHVLTDKWLLVGGTGNGVCYRWFRDNFAQVEAEVAKCLNKDPYEIMDMETQQAEPGSDNLIFLPHLTGARSPIWNSNMRGVYFGIGLHHQKKHFMRAIMEGIAYSVRHRMKVMEKELGVSIDQIRVVGGGGRSAIWRQIMADVYNKLVVWPNVAEPECLGSIILAGSAVSLYADVAEASEKMVAIVDRSEPKKENCRKYDRLFDVYVRLCESLKSSFNILSKS